MKPFAHGVSLLPLVWLIWLGVQGQFGPNPAEFINRYTGDWALRFLLIALAVTPLRGLTGWNQLARLRRMIGLYAFFYALLHMANYVALDQYLDWFAIWEDIIKRNFITVGMVAFVILTALAMTSPQLMVKKLGGKRWQSLHRWVYVAGLASCIHFIMMRKGFQIEPLIYLSILMALLGYRIAVWSRKRRRVADAQTA